MCVERKVAKKPDAGAAEATTPTSNMKAFAKKAKRQSEATDVCSCPVCISVCLM